MKLDEEYMRAALEQAKSAYENGWIPVGAVFVLAGRIVVTGTKRGVSHQRFDHAEHNGCYDALSRDGLRNLAGFTVYTTLEPCVMCMGMLMTARVRHIVYALEDPYGGGKYMLDDTAGLPQRFVHERPALIGGVLREQSKALLRQYFTSAHACASWKNQDNALVRLVLAD